MGRHKKKQVQDKYYQLAKEQGYRARSSFKLIQLNRKYDLLSKATRVIDLCAAPGGWLQVCVKNMPKKPDMQIIGVDLLPIKAIRGCVTLQADITTQECKVMIKKEMNNNKADLVLCDGAPNVGAEYTKDAFVQNELTVHALRFACDHLVKGGNFVTKVFRSGDYNALMWSFQQLFKKVEATKPASSRNVSAEIFVVCRGFLAPHKIDPRLLDPRHVLEQVSDNNNLTEEQRLNQMFHKKTKQKRNRQGYDDDVGQGMFSTCSAIEFVQSKEPVTILAKTNTIHFKDQASKDLLSHKGTTGEIVSCLEDLKVLGKSDLRALLKWRVDMRKHLEDQRDAAENSSSDDDDADDGNSSEEGEDNDQASDSDDSMEDVNEELAKLKESKRRQAKRELRKKRKARIQHQRRVDLGMESEFVLDLSEDHGPFSLKNLGLKSMKHLSKVQQGTYVSEDDESSSSESESDDDVDDPRAARARYMQQIEEEASIAHQRLSSKEIDIAPLSVRQRRQQLVADKKAKMKKKTLETLAENDFHHALEKEQRKVADQGAYAEMLAANRSDSDDDGDDDDSSSDDEEGVVVDPVSNKKRKFRMVGELKDEVNETERVDRWFKQPLFEGAEDSSSDENDQVEDRERENNSVPLPSERTDKAKRHEKRKKTEFRKERKEEKKRKQHAKELSALGLEPKAPTGFETVPQDDDRAYGDEDDEEAKEKPQHIKDLIRKGMGKKQQNGASERKGFEVVKAETYNSDDDEEEEGYNSEDYDIDERAKHLALGMLLTKKSKRRKLLDAAYNRYAFNDPELPEWFVEDENKHNRPQIPITKEMVEAIKARNKDLASKPINKVAEARARKKRKLLSKVQKAKKQAAVIAEEPDMTARAKMRAIEKVYKGATIKRPSSVYVVARKAQQGRVNLGSKLKGKSVKIVDKRMKADQPRSEKGKKRGGKKGGKRRR